MPSRAWVVTARMSNILNFLWYFLCIPAIYKCILAYLSIFSTNYLSFWGANPLVLFWELTFHTTLLFDGNKHQRLTHGLIPHFYDKPTIKDTLVKLGCQCPLGLITHFYVVDNDFDDEIVYTSVSMPSRAYNSFLQIQCCITRSRRSERVNALSGL